MNEAHNSARQIFSKAQKAMSMLPDLNAKLAVAEDDVRNVSAELAPIRAELDRLSDALHFAQRAWKQARNASTERGEPAPARPAEIAAIISDIADTADKVMDIEHRQLEIWEARNALLIAIRDCHKAIEAAR